MKASPASTVQRSKPSRWSGTIVSRPPIERAAIAGCLAFALGQVQAASTAGATDGAAQDPTYLQRFQQKLPLAPAPKVDDLRHGIVHYDKGTYCGHPRQVAFGYFGNGEIVVGHNHAPARYEDRDSIKHDLGGYHSRAVQLLQRSLDGGLTWPHGQDVVVYNEAMSEADKKRFLHPSGASRSVYDMFAPDSMFFFARTYLPESRGKSPVCFSLRSSDRGRTWEQVPTIVRHPDGEQGYVQKDGAPPVMRMPDGKTLLALASDRHADNSRRRSTVVYASTDQGVTWNYLSRPAEDISGQGAFTYPALLLLPNGELQAYFLHIDNDRGGENARNPVDGLKNAICLTRSNDGGKTWGEPASIVGQGTACWKRPGDVGVLYRSPWPMLLQDGRILVAFARRRPPSGIGGVVSSDRGRTWSEEFVIRDDGVGKDLGYPVGAQLEHGRIFLAYYFTMNDGNGQGGTRYVASSSFHLR